MTEKPFSIRRKRPKINGHNVIGIDEVHNGFHLNKKHKVNLPFVMTGYLKRNYQGKGLQGHNTMYGRKCGAFNLDSKRSSEDIAERAVQFLSMNPDFLYSRIAKERCVHSEIAARAESITAITSRFIQEEGLKEEDTFVCIDRPNDLSFADTLDNALYEFFKMANLFPGSYQKHVYFQDKADNHNVATRLADRCGYYILALKFRTERSRWPHRDRSIYDEEFMDLVCKRNGLLN